MTTEQPMLWPGINPDQLIAETKAAHKPVAAVCLFSGGNDSTVLAHRCRDHYTTLVHIDTGTAVPGVREFVEQYAAWLNKPLRVYEAGDAFRRMVLGPLGFPGPAQHGRAYTRLKERQIETLVRDLKTGRPRTARIMLLTGKRRAESARRKQTTKGVDRKGGQLYVNPLIDWTDHDMRRYRATHYLPESDVAALIHRSGECNCGSFAAPGEREMLASLWPAWFEATIASLEREAATAGIAACRWGERPDTVPIEETGPLCSSCEARLFDLENAA